MNEVARLTRSKILQALHVFCHHNLLLIDGGAFHGFGSVLSARTVRVNMTAPSGFGIMIRIPFAALKDPRTPQKLCEKFLSRVKAAFNPLCGLMTTQPFLAFHSDGASIDVLVATMVLASWVAGPELLEPPEKKQQDTREINLVHQFRSSLSLPPDAVVEIH